MTYEEKRQLYEKIMNRISVNVKRMLNEKYGSAHNNSNIFTSEIKDVIYNVLDSIRDKSYLNWEKINVYEDEVLYNKIFWLKNTDWMEGVQICIWPGCARFINKKAKASYFDGQIEDSGKMTAAINLFNVIPGKCEDMYYDYFIHEFKHAYFDYTKMKSCNRKQSQIYGRRFSLYDKIDGTQFDLKEISSAELLKKYENDKKTISKDILFCLLYIASDAETAAYAESLSLEITRCFKKKWSLVKLKKDSTYTNIFIKLKMIMDKIENDFNKDNDFKQFLDDVCRKHFHVTLRNFWTLSRKNIRKQVTNIRKTISLYY